MNTMNKTITAETRLNNIKSLCAERDREEAEKKEYRIQTVS